MGTFFIILSILLAALAVFGIGLYLHSRRTLRVQKNYERGLKRCRYLFICHLLAMILKPMVETYAT